MENLKNEADSRPETQPTEEQPDGGGTQLKVPEEEMLWNLCENETEKTLKDTKPSSHSKKVTKHALRQQAKRRRKNTNIAAGNPAPAQRHVISPTSCEIDDMNWDTACYRQPTMNEILASIPGFSLKPRKRSQKKLSAAAQLEQTKEGCIDLETPDSILVNANLRSLLNKHTFSSLPSLYQYKLLQLLPHVDRTGTGNDSVYRLSGSGLNNEFFARACLEWRERLSEGEFTQDNQARLKLEQEKEKSRLDPWKLKHFEPTWGESLREWPVHPEQMPASTGATAPSPGGGQSQGSGAVGGGKVKGGKSSPVRPPPPPPPAPRVRTVGAVTRAVTSYREKRAALSPPRQHSESKRNRPTDPEKLEDAKAMDTIIASEDQAIVSTIEVKTENNFESKDIVDHDPDASAGDSEVDKTSDLDVAIEVTINTSECSPCIESAENILEKELTANEMNDCSANQGDVCEEAQSSGMQEFSDEASYSREASQQTTLVFSEDSSHLTIDTCSEETSTSFKETFPAPNTCSESPRRESPSHDKGFSFTEELHSPQEDSSEAQSMRAESPPAQPSSAQAEGSSDDRGSLLAPSEADYSKTDDFDTSASNEESYQQEIIQSNSEEVPVNEPHKVESNANQNHEDSYSNPPQALHEMSSFSNYEKVENLANNEDEKCFMFQQSSSTEENHGFKSDGSSQSSVQITNVEQVSEDTDVFSSQLNESQHMTERGELAAPTASQMSPPEKPQLGQSQYFPQQTNHSEMLLETQVDQSHFIQPSQQTQSIQFKPPLQQQHVHQQLPEIYSNQVDHYQNMNHKDNIAMPLEQMHSVSPKQNILMMPPVVLDVQQNNNSQEVQNNSIQIPISKQQEINTNVSMAGPNEQVVQGMQVLTSSPLPNIPVVSEVILPDVSGTHMLSTRTVNDNEEKWEVIQVNQDKNDGLYFKEEEAAILAAAWDVVGSAPQFQDLQPPVVIPLQEELEVRLQESSLPAPQWLEYPNTSDKQHSHGHVKLELEVTLTPEVDSQVTSSSMEVTGEPRVIPPTTIVCLPQLSAGAPPPPSVPASSAAIPYLSLTTSTPVRAIPTKPVQSKGGGRGGRGTNKPPPGAVNLERSYQICQAVIQNSPNRHQLRCQLKPPPPLLGKRLGQQQHQPSPLSQQQQQQQQRTKPRPQGVVLRHMIPSNSGAIPVSMAVLPSQHGFAGSGTRRSNSAPPSNSECQGSTGRGRPASVGESGVGCRGCSMRPLVPCRRCGDFCHEDCITPARLCVTCHSA